MALNKNKYQIIKEEHIKDSFSELYQEDYLYWQEYYPDDYYRNYYPNYYYRNNDGYDYYVNPDGIKLCITNDKNKQREFKIDTLFGVDNPKIGDIFPKK